MALVPQRKELTVETTFRIATVLSSLLLFAAPLAAQAPPNDSGSAPSQTAQEDQAAEQEGRQITMQHFRPLDQRGINVFETPKASGVEYTGFKLDFGAAFTSQVQALDHENAAAPRIVNGVNVNELANIGFGFNNSTANLYLQAQLAEGIRVQLTTYLSSRHHTERG